MIGCMGLHMDPVLLVGYGKNMRRQIGGGEAPI